MRKFLLAVSVLVLAMIACSESTPTPTARPTKPKPTQTALNTTCLRLYTVKEFYNYAYDKNIVFDNDTEGHDLGMRDMEDGHAIGVNIGVADCVNQITAQILTDFEDDTLGYLLMPALMYQKNESLRDEHSEFVSANIERCQHQDAEENMYSGGYTIHFECFYAEPFVVITLGVWER